MPRGADSLITSSFSFQLIHRLFKTRCRPVEVQDTGWICTGIFMTLALLSRRPSQRPSQCESWFVQPFWPRPRQRCVSNIILVASGPSREDFRSSSFKLVARIDRAIQSDSAPLHTVVQWLDDYFHNLNPFVTLKHLVEVHSMLPIQSHHCLTSEPSKPVTLPPRIFTWTLKS